MIILLTENTMESQIMEQTRCQCRCILTTNSFNKTPDWNGDISVVGSLECRNDNLFDYNNVVYYIITLRRS
jgi:hypothetical protein